MIPSEVQHILWRKDLPEGDPEKLSIRTAAEMLGVDVSSALKDIRADEWGEWEWQTKPITMDRWMEYVYDFWMNAYLRRLRKPLLPDTGACDAPTASVSP